MSTRAQVVDEARTWLGTPWQHQQRLKGVAVDCAGLVVGVGRACGLLPAEADVEGYSRQPDGSLLPTCDKYLQRISAVDIQPGDVLVIAVDREPQHVALVGNYRHGGLSIIHAVSTARPPRVIETRLMLARNLRIVAAYSFPGVQP
jgi:cell wall-associated NlpC family hydrolase